VPAHGLHLVATPNDTGRSYNAVIISHQASSGSSERHLWNERTSSSSRATSASRLQDANRSYQDFICYDGWFPESYRLCALQGADIVCIPTNWVPIPGQAKNREAMANILVMAAAHANSVFAAAADRVGTERGQPFIGQSLIASYTGWPIAGPASPDTEEILYAEANLADARRKRNWTEYNQVLRDRRTDVYDEMLGAKTTKGWY
jgi:predicted amidohydrolase